MMRMMEQCWNWMVSFGAVGLIVFVLLVAALIAFVVWLVRRSSR